VILPCVWALTAGNGTKMQIHVSRISHHNTIVSHMIKHTSLHFLYGTLPCMYSGGWGAKRKTIQLCYYVFIFLHQVSMFFQYIPNEVFYVSNLCVLSYDLR
jgi:hypothetical protein